MVIPVWGTRVRSPVLGHVAEYCRGCAGVTDHELCEVIHAPHLGNVPTERGKVVGYRVRCGECAAQTPAAPERYLAMTREILPLERLQCITNPGVLAEREERKREERARRGHPGPAERIARMQESLVAAERAAAAPAAAPRLDRRSGAILLSTVALGGLGLLGVAGPEGGTVRALVCTGLAGAATGVVLLVHSLVTDVSRFVHRRLGGAIRDALRPYEPSPLEIQQLLRSMGASGWVLGRELRVDGLTRDLHPPSAGRKGAVERPVRLPPAQRGAGRQKGTARPSSNATA